jgi:hypothetical protein
LYRYTTDGPRFVLNVSHILAVPLAFVLLFLKMWNDRGAIDWWIVAVIPAGVLTRAVIDQLWAVVMEIPKTEYNQLGYGREGGAFEYAFSEPQDDDVEIVEERTSSRAARRSSSKKKSLSQPTTSSGGAKDDSLRGGWAAAGRTRVDSVRVSLDNKV